MNKIPVDIEIQTRQTLEDGTSQKFSSREKGFLHERGGLLFISYLEAGEDGGKGTQTVWKVEPIQASLIRQGDTGLRVSFRNGLAESTTLVTPHGILPVEIQTFRLEHDLTLAGGVLKVGYSMDIGGAVSRMEVEMQVNTAIN